MIKDRFQKSRKGKPNQLGRKIAARVVLLLFAVLLVSGALVLLNFIRTGRVGSGGRVTLAVNLGSKDDTDRVFLLTILPVQKEATLVSLPGELKTEAPGFGMWKVGVLYRLGEMGDLSGELLARSLENS